MLDESGDRNDERRLPAPSDIIAGKYEVEQVVASGGMGVVVLARHLHLDQRVAVKLLLPHMAERGDIVTRFLREARAAVSLHGEHAVRVYDVGVLESGAPYMVMEYLRGHDLDEELKRSGARSVSDAAAWVLEACEAIAEAHSLGIVHRDIKPANLFLAKQPDGSRIVKVLDFGISKVSETDAREAQKLTSTQTVLGSPQYMSPEQVRNAKNVDGRSDIWALGVVLYELVMDAPPFPAETVPALSAMIVSDPPAPMNADVPAEFQTVVLRCLEKDPAKRFQTVVELATALAPFAPDSPRAAERIAGIARRAGHSEPPPAPGGPSADAVPTRDRRAASPDAETVSAAGVVPVSAKSAPSAGSTFSATMQSAKPRPVRRIAATAVVTAGALFVVVTIGVRAASSGAKRDVVSPVPAPAPSSAPAFSKVEEAPPAPATAAEAVASAAPADSAAPASEFRSRKAARVAAPARKATRADDHSAVGAPRAPSIESVDPLGDRK